MASVKAITALVRRGTCSTHGHRRLLHHSSARYAITNLEMPAMSPTMTEGGIASWKKKEGEAFAPGDVLLEIETDKATIDVEAQEDGVMGKILLPDGSKNIPVGKVIALLAEEGDDISNLQPPIEEKPVSKVEEAYSSPAPSTTQPESPKPAPELPALASTQLHSPTHLSHSRPLFPSVYRLLSEHNISNPEKIKGTGVRGMLTKGDVLAFLGKASGPSGTYKDLPAAKQTGKSEKQPEVKPLDGATIRQLIVTSMLKSSLAARNAASAPESAPDFDSIIADYLPASASPSPKAALTRPPARDSASDYLDGLY